MVGAPVTATAGLQSFRIEALFSANERRLGQFLVAMVRDRALAEDLLQETFLDAYSARERLRDVAQPDAWLFGIARNRALRALRRRRRLQRAVERLWQTRAEADWGHDQIGVMDVLDRVLSPDDRSLVLLRYVHDLDAPTLAALTGRSPAAIRKRLERACAALRKEIEP
jgi:RNA polymerase sigma-70 factor (ECF subfamily)